MSSKKQVDKSPFKLINSFLLKYGFWIVFGVFVLLHLFLLNINQAEWGDSYRILRASEFVRNFTYPTDEKRPPLFSILLAFRPSNVEQILWGRMIMFVLSLGFLVTFYSYIKTFFSKHTNNSPNVVSQKVLLGLVLLAFNPVFFYWSMRIYADVFFTFISLVGFMVYYVYRDRQKSLRIFAALLGLISGLAVLTRFEGYILFGALGLGIIYKSNFNLKEFFPNIIKRFSHIFMYVLTFVITVLPYLLFKNPLTSSYLAEPSGRAYDLKMGLTFLFSLVFIFGFTSAISFLKLSKIKSFMIKNTSIASFVLVELFLILLWPAAIPRLFVPVIPYLVILLADCIVDWFNEPRAKMSRSNIFRTHYPLILGSVLLFTFAVGQYFLRLQFQILQKPVFAAIIAIQALLLITSFYKKYALSFNLILISMIVWTVSVVFLHKDIYYSLSEASKYSLNNLSGNVAFNDINAVSDWYLNYAKKDSHVDGVFIKLEEGQNISLDSLRSQDIDYILVTNEHNTNLPKDLLNKQYLEEIKVFEKTLYGVDFHTKVLKVNYDEKTRQ